MITSNNLAPGAVYADLRTDFMFKKAFGQKDIMIPFLNDILGTDKIQDIDYHNVEQLGFDAEDRKVYYDLYCHCSDGKDFIVEMQRRSQRYYRERMVFYSTYPIQQQYIAAKLKHEETHPVDPFIFDYRLCPLYIISITDFVLEHDANWPKDKFVSWYWTTERETRELYCNTPNYIFIELPRFKKVLQQNSALTEKWAYVFNNLAELKAVPDELSEKYFRKLFETAKIVNFTDVEQSSYIEDQKMKYDYENVMEYAVEQATKQAAEKAKAKGKAEGLAEGEARKGLEIARNLLSMGLSAEQIVRATGLSSAEVSALR
jgi:predicted transposase/invertase (TIGR01784 family)